VTITVEAPPPPPTEPALHVAALDGSAKTTGKTKWSATAKATILDGADRPVRGATVSFIVDPGSSASCTTNRKGTCSVSSSRFGSGTPSVTFTVADVALDGWIFDADGSVTTIIVPSPL
jgi:hypothetical protein